MDTGSSGNTLEHTLPATIVGKYLFKKALDGTVKDSFKMLRKIIFRDHCQFLMTINLKAQN